MYALNTLLGPDIGELVAQRKFDQLREALIELDPADVGELVSGLDGEQAAVVFRLLPRVLAADTFSHLDGEQQQGLISHLSTERVAALINELDPDDRTALLEELPAEVAQRLIALLSPSERRVTQTILGYPEESIGRLMTPDYVRIKADWTIGRALDHIRKYGRDAETISVIYVVDDGGRLVDDLRIQQILLADPQQSVESTMDRNVVALRADEEPVATSSAVELPEVVEAQLRLRLRPERRPRLLASEVAQDPVPHALARDGPELLLDRPQRVARALRLRQVELHRVDRGEPADRPRQVEVREQLLSPVSLEREPEPS